MGWRIPGWIHQPARPAHPGEDARIARLAVAVERLLDELQRREIAPLRVVQAPGSARLAGLNALVEEAIREMTSGDSSWAKTLELLSAMAGELRDMLEGAPSAETPAPSPAGRSGQVGSHVLTPAPPGVTSPQGARRPTAQPDLQPLRNALAKLATCGPDHLGATLDGIAFTAMTAWEQLTGRTWEKYVD